jgi:SOS-response transcriptional repressor LexA
VGQLAAGRSIEYLPIVRWRDVRLPRWARGNDRFVCAEICGDSLKDKGIFDGDIALIHLTHDITPGDLAAILTPEGMLIKFVFVEDGKLRLESANRKYPSRYFDLADVEVQGRVIRTERDW